MWGLTAGNRPVRSDNRPGVCQCSHSRRWHNGIGGKLSCKVCTTCEGFTGPVEVVIRQGSRNWPLGYTVYGRVAHILDPAVSSNSSDPALCGAHPYPYCWRGAGSPKENNRIRKLRLCLRCTSVFEKHHTPKKG